MAWNRRYSLVSYLKSSLWVVPVLAVVAALALSRAAEQAATWLPAAGLPSTVWALDKAEAAALLERIFGLNASCLIFAFGSLLVAIQVASGQYTPRIIATTLLRDRVIRWIVGLFVFSMLWANRALQLLGEGREVPRLQVYVGAMLGLASLVAFILLIDYAARQLRPVSIAIRVGREGVAVIQRVYPKPVAAFPEPPPLPARPRPGALPLDGALAAPARAIPYAGRSAVVLALNVKALVDEARRSDCTVEFAAQVGDFLGVGEPLFYVYGGGARIDERRLCRLVATGGERTMEQDPMFAFRIVVDIALKALSSAINDPTTAVIAIDQLQRLLGMVGKRTLRDHEIRDGAGKVRLILRTPDWEDYVHMSFREIMYYGAGSLQVERRLRAMVETLLATLPPHRHPALRAELDLIDAEAQKAHRFRADALLARVPDSQGLGGASGARDHEAAGAHPAP